ncbi:exotoxin beta-grasp domain-containing protein, partial [Staphylococcus aureus]|uniref:exotoxin beta-grasp domain-containing protein n=1 Tax=Staphylococcus aureus TaxID=1280 RepID=UPI003F968131
MRTGKITVKKKYYGKYTFELDKKLQEDRMSDVINDPDVKQFLEAHRAELTNAMIDEDLNVLQEDKDQQKHYDGHKFADCPNFVKGHVPELYVDNMRFYLLLLPFLYKGVCQMHAMQYHVKLPSDY